MINSSFRLAIKDRLIRVAIIGCGRIGYKHLKSVIFHQDNLHLVAICDKDLDNLEKAKDFLENEFDQEDKINNISFYSNFDSLLEDNLKKKLNIDLVVLATPSGLHAMQTIKAAKNGMHVCTEKPMATKWSDGLLMVKECEDAGVNLFVVKQNRYNQTLQILKRQIQAKRFGKIFMISVNVFWQRPQSYYDKDKWRGTWELDGGALMNQASHYVDLIYWLNGSLESLSAESATLGRKIEVEDTLAMNMKWENGTLGTMAVTMLTYPENLEGSITILGEKGSVKLGGKAVNKFDYWKFDSESEDDHLVENSNYQTKSVYGFGHPIFYKDMIKKLKGEESSICTGYDGLKSLEIIIAAYRAAKTGEKVYFPLFKNSN